MTAEMLFETIANALVGNHDSVAMGKMMSSPGITYNGKVFAFFHEGVMTFKLGEDFVPEDMGINDYQLLAPFKTKAPMRAWFSIPYAQYEHWQDLAERALVFIQS